MDGKAVRGIMLTLLLIGALGLVFDESFVGVRGTTYRADGSVGHASMSSTKGSSLLLNGGFENWSGTPLLPDGWSIVTIFPNYDPGAIHRSTIAHRGNFSLRLGGENASEVGWNLGVVMDQNVSVCVGVAYHLAFYAFGRNPWGNLAGGISVDWLNASKKVIAGAIPRVSLPAGGVSSYTLFAGASGFAPSDAVYARIYIEKKSYGFINFDNVTFAPKGPVGGIWISVDKFGLLTPYIALVSTIVSAIVATMVFIKLKKRKR